MAKGRLGKAKITSKETAAVYTNSSGNEASITIKAQSTAGTAFHLRLDDSSSNLTQSVTLVSEAYDERYLKYPTNNTLLTDTAASQYLGRNMFVSSTGRTATTNITSQFETYLATNTTTYTFSTSDQRQATCLHQWPYETWSSVHADSTHMIHAGNTSNMNAFYRHNEGPADVAASNYYNRVVNGSDSEGHDTAIGLSYYSSGIVFDPWSANPLIGIGLDNNAFMTGIATKTSDSGFGSNNRTSDSWYYDQITSSASLPTGAYQYRRLYLQNQAAVADSCNDSTTAVINFFGDSFDLSSSSNGISNSMVDSGEARGFKYANNVTRRGGHTVFFEYNPTDGLHYWCYYRNSDTTYYLATFDRDAVRAGKSNNSITTLSRGVDQPSLGVLHAEISLTVASPFDFGTSQDNTSRCTFIGTLEKPLWALVFFRYNDNTASHTYYSTDLKTWQRSTDYFGSNDYLELVNDTTVTSNSGVVTAVKSNITNLGTDGVLEESTTFNHYENTGLVISNGDRVLVYNSGANDCVVQVMGYEGE